MGASYSTLLIPALPLIAFLVMLPMSRRVRNMSIALPVIAVLASLIISASRFIRILPGAEMGHSFWSMSWPFATIGGMPIELSMSLDSLAAIIMTMVTIVALCVLVFSVAYMAEDERRGWYFAVVSLFTSAMLFLVLAADLLLMFIAWEVMGVCSYLLIGFWFKDQAPRQASQKAFLYTRAADLGFFVALATIFGVTGSFGIESALAAAESWAPMTVAIVSFGLIVAAMGKSAQFPLMVWLPDAMAGPTPASALIHAATMVAAGVFMLARMLPIIELSHDALVFMSWVGAFTALVAGFMAVAQTDLKKVLAYSTVSQLGFMFIGLGAGAVGAALFHLTTHAFFKSLLFLAAGIIIHATHTQDMRKMGGLARQMPVTTTVFSIGAFALAGLLPLSGFFSKDEIFHAAQSHGPVGVYPIALLVGATTAFYVTKTWLTVFFGKSKSHAHEGSLLELLPVSLLAVITATLGFFSPSFAEYLGHHGAWPSPEMAVTSTLITLLGITLGFFAWRGHFARSRMAAAFAPVKTAFDNNLFFDYGYDLVVIRPYIWVTEALWKFDARFVDGAVNAVAAGYRKLADFGWAFDRTVVDGLVNGAGEVSRRVGRGFRKLQSGEINRYQSMVAGATVILMLWVVIQMLLDVPKGA